MNNVTYVIDQEIAALEYEMIEKKKHIISSESLKIRTRAHLPLDASSEDAKYCISVGLNHMIYDKLYQKGYRSVRQGYLVNLDRCNDVDYLVKLSENADLYAEEKKFVSERIKEIRNTRCDGQIKFDKDGEIIDALTEEEFMEKVVKDAV